VVSYGFVSVAQSDRQPLLLLTEAHDAEHDGQDDESHQLDWLAADRVDCSDGDPISRNGARTNKYNVTHGQTGNRCQQEICYDRERLLGVINTDLKKVS
jgi:hypothetical protein